MLHVRSQYVCTRTYHSHTTSARSLAKLSIIRGKKEIEENVAIEKTLFSSSSSSRRFFAQNPQKNERREEGCCCSICSRLVVFVVSHGVAGHAHAPARSPVPRAPSPRSTDAVRDGGRDERQHRLDGDVVRHRGFVSIDPTGREGRNGNDDKV